MEILVSDLLRTLRRAPSDPGVDREWSCVGNVAEFRSLGSKAFIHDQVIHATGDKDRQVNAEHDPDGKIDALMHVSQQLQHWRRFTSHPEAREWLSCFPLSQRKEAINPMIPVGGAKLPTRHDGSPRVVEV
ncbi:hypothetical protein ACCS68_34985 [Rhizobium beringeri]|uniref:hypothetical protein n=1 Tax=Rhizobium beringeri TaxID=3019934 RepID=UPI003CF90189